MIRVFFRSFLIQCAWNFERMQNIGFAYAMAPALKRLYPEKAQRIKALKRHLEFFNTHPYMSTLVLGAAVRAEEEGDKSRVSALKAGLMGPLAAMGDSFFWATLRPLAALLAVAAGWMIPQAPAWSLLALYLLCFNLPHLAIRISGLEEGYRLGFGVTSFLKKVDVQGLIASLRMGALVVLGAVLACFGHFTHPVSGQAMPMGGSFLYIGLGICLLMALRLKVSVTRILAALGAASLILGGAFFEPLSVL